MIFSTKMAIQQNMGYSMMAIQGNMRTQMQIYIAKSFSAVFEKSDKVPVFNEFDIWKPCSNEPIKYLSLILVEIYSNLATFFVIKSEFMVWQIFA